MQPEIAAVGRVVVRRKGEVRTAIETRCCIKCQADVRAAPERGANHLLVRRGNTNPSNLHQLSAPPESCAGTSRV